LVSGTPLSDMIVRIGAARTTTGADGAFSVANVPPTYDLAVIDASGEAITLYRGLHRRDVLLVHRPAGHHHGGPAHSARIQGKLSGGGPYPLTDDFATIEFSSLAVHATENLGGGGELPDPGGPHYGPLTVPWAGSDEIEGEIFATRINDEP